MKNKSIQWLSSLATAILLVSLQPITAAESVKSADSVKKVAGETEKKVKSADKAVRFPFHGKLKEVDAKKGTFTLHGAEKDRVFKTSTETVITRNGKKAALTDGKAEEEVGGYCERQANGSVMALKLRFGPKPADDKDEDEKHVPHKKPSDSQPPKPVVK